MPELEASLEPGSLRRLVQASRTWDKVARAEMRKGLREAASKGAEAAQREVMEPPPARGAAALTRRPGKSTGMRAGLAKGVKVAIRTGRESSSGVVSGEGVRVTTTGSKLSPGKAPMVKAYMAREFRHPVFGSGTYVTQRGKNWFYGPLMAGREDYQREVVKAIEAAAQAIARD